jgi:hypothetical protein
VLIHLAKAVKAMLTQENPEAAREHTPLCRGPSQERHHVLHPRRSSR